jgi:hypothetical protein
MAREAEFNFLDMKDIRFTYEQINNDIQHFVTIFKQISTQLQSEQQSPL